jgi:hypothetical protein
MPNLRPSVATTGTVRRVCIFKVNDVGSEVVKEDGSNHKLNSVAR